MTWVQNLDEAVSISCYANTPGKAISWRIVEWTWTLVWQPIKEKEKSEFKPIKLYLKNLPFFISSLYGKVGKYIHLLFGSGNSCGNINTSFYSPFLFPWTKLRSWRRELCHIGNCQYSIQPCPGMWQYAEAVSCNWEIASPLIHKVMLPPKYLWGNSQYLFEII